MPSLEKIQKMKKKQKKKALMLYNSVRLFEEENLKKKEEDQWKGWISIEWVGKQFNLTPACDFTVGIVIHKEQEIPEEDPNPFKIKRSSLLNFNNMCNYLRTYAVEGFVFEDLETH